MTTNDTLTPATVTVTDDTFAREIAQGVTMVDFWAAWCGPCRMIAPVIDQLAREYEGRAKIANLDTDANPATMARFNVRSIPSILFFKDGTLVDRVVGAVPRAVLEQRLQALL